MEKKEILEECRDLIEQVSEKFGYNSQDVEGNKSLKTVLLKVVPAMLKDSDQEGQNLFYQMLSHTPIVITENLTQESYKKLLEKYIGNNVNEHIVEEQIDLGEYGKEIGEGAYVSEAIFDENMNLQGKKSFIYVPKVTDKKKEFYGTDINVSYLIHELGHAWHAEKEQFVMQQDGTLKERVGALECIYSFSKLPDNKIAKKCIKTTGLMIEESMNTLEEEIATANYMDISLEEMREEYNNTLFLNSYQGYMTNFIAHMLEKLGKEDFENYRLYGEKESINKINELMEKTNYWKNRETDILPSSNSPRNYDKKRAVFDQVGKQSIQDFLSEYEDVYFPDISKMTPIEKINNVLEQKFNLNNIRYHMGIDNYKAFLEILDYECYSLVNQTALLRDSQKDELESTTEKAKKIEPPTVLKNALMQGTTTEQINKANSIEYSALNPEHAKEGETKDD